MTSQPTADQPRTTRSATRTAACVLGAAAMLVAASAGGAAADRLITGRQIKDNTITSADIKAKTLKVSDLSPAALQAQRGERGPAGPGGAQGPAGASGFDSLVTRTTIIEPRQSPNLTAAAWCRRDERIVSGGATNRFRLDGLITQSAPVKADLEEVLDGASMPLGGGWMITLVADEPNGQIGGTIYAVCAPAT